MDKNNKKVDFINCEMIGQHTEKLCQYVNKGKAILVEGELNIGAFNDGVWTKYTDTVMAYEYAKLGHKSTSIHLKYIIQGGEDVFIEECEESLCDDVNGDAGHFCEAFGAEVFIQPEADL
mgnify:CR=1 FL=1